MTILAEESSDSVVELFSDFSLTSSLYRELLTIDEGTWLIDSGPGRVFADRDWPLIPSFSQAVSPNDHLLTSPFWLRSITVARRHVATVAKTFTAILLVDTPLH